MDLRSDTLYIVDRIAKTLIWFSIGMYFWELTYHTRNSYESPLFFLWTERFVATVFLIEYFIRLSRGGKDYFKSGLGLIDLMAWLPFLVGFVVPPDWLGYIRTARIFRLLKYVRYSRDMQLVFLAFYRASRFLRTMAVVMIMICLFSSVILFETEPETFDNEILNAVWFTIVTASTVGYGDISPQTDIGKILAVILLFIPAIGVFAGMIGVMGGMFTVVLEEEKDPSIDPIQRYWEGTWYH